MRLPLWLSRLFGRKPTPPIVTTPVVPPSPPRYGELGITADPQDIPTLKALGIKRVRMTLIWRNYEGDTRQFAPDRKTIVDSGGETVKQFFANDLNAFTSAGIEPFVVVHTPPDGMSFDDGLHAMPVFMGKLAAKFPGTAWQILNEMDGEDGFNGGWFQARDVTQAQHWRGRLYGELLWQVIDEMREWDINSRIICGGICAGDDGRLAAEFYHGMTDALGAMRPDAIAVHCYGPPCWPAFRNKARAMKAVIGNTPLWCTEFGSNFPTDAEQLSDFTDCFRYQDTERLYERKYVYRLTSSDLYAIQRADGSLRPAAELLRERGR
jgi:hypothetical protein